MFIFDTISLSLEIMQKLSILGVSVDGIIDVRNSKSEHVNLVSLDSVIRQRGFIIFPIADYPDHVFNLLRANGYNYNQNYVIYR